LGERYEEALAVYDKHPEFVLPDSAVKEIIKALKEVGRYEDAISLSKSFLEKDSSNIDVRINLIYSLIQAKDFESATDQLLNALQDHPDILRFKSLQALLFASQKKWLEFFDAIKYLTDAMTEDGKAGILSDMNEGFYLVYDEAIAFARNDQFEEALNLLDQLEVFENKSQQIRMDRIVINIWQEKFEEACPIISKWFLRRTRRRIFSRSCPRLQKKREEITMPEKHWRYISPYVEAIEEQEYEKQVQLAFIRSNMEEGDTEKR